MADSGEASEGAVVARVSDGLSDLDSGDPDSGGSGGLESSELSALSVVVTANIRLAGLRVFTVGRTAILLMDMVVAENADPGAFEVITKFSSSSMLVLRLVKSVLKWTRWIPEFQGHTAHDGECVLLSTVGFACHSCIYALAGP